MLHARSAASFLAGAMLFLLAAASAVQAATQDRRVALVIGNSDYSHTAALKNPVRDARAMAAALAGLGFEVVEGYDLEQPAMRAKIREFTSRIESADVTLFYYAGHGFQIDGKNHLAPVDARLSGESDVDFETIPLNLVLRQMERARRTNLIFLDACRDNPLATRLARSLQGRSIAPERGLARVESGVGTLIGYATSPGMVAYDGEGEHSPYTQALLKHIGTPGLSINDMMIAVRQDVLAASKGKQIPWEHSSLTGQYYFKEPVKTAALDEGTPAEAGAGAASPVKSAEDEQAVTEAYRATVAVGSCGAYRIFEERHRGSFYGRLAEEHLKTHCSADTRLIAVEPRPEEAATPDSPDIKTAATEPAASAAAEKAEEVEEAAEPELDPGELTASIQRELARVGCDPGRADGDWGPRTRGAMRSFNENAALDLDDDEPSEEALDALREQSGRVCPQPAPATVKKTPPATAKRPAPERTVRTAPRTPSGNIYERAPRKEKQYWGGEDTRFDCEVRGIITAQCFEKPPR